MYVSLIHYLCSSFTLLPTGVNYRTYAGFGQGSGPILVDDLDCYGSEHRLSDCQYHNNTDGHAHNEDWGVICYTGILLHTSIYVLHTACVTTSIQTRTMILLLLLCGLCVTNTNLCANCRWSRIW